MSCKKYVLKKDLVPIKLKSPEKFNKSLLSPVQRLKLRKDKNGLGGLFPYIRRSEQTAKSLNTLKNSKKIKNLSAGRKEVNASLPHRLQKESINVNLRYLKNSFHDAEENNAIETPSESQKSRKDFFQDIICEEYQNYLELKQKPLFYTIKNRSITPNCCENLDKRKLNFLNESPRIDSFWKTKKIY